MHGIYEDLKSKVIPKTTSKHQPIKKYKTISIVERFFESNVKVDLTLPLASTMRSAIFRCDPFQCEVLVLSV